MKLDLRLQRTAGNAPKTRLADLRRQAEFNIWFDQPPVSLQMQINKRESRLVCRGIVGSGDSWTLIFGS